MMNRIFIGFAMVVLVIGSYRAFTTDYPGMGLLLAFGALALTVPVFFDRK